MRVPFATPLRLLVALALLVACASAPPPAATATTAAASAAGRECELVTRRRPVPLADAERIPVGTSPTLGRPDALVTVVEFGDFQCPFCARAEGTLARLRLRYGDDLRVVWKNNPLAFHDRAMPAAEAAMEAYAQGGNAMFWEYHDQLLDSASGDGLEREDLERYAEQLGLDMTRFRRALDDHTHQAAIRADMALAERVGAEGTPNFFINGTQLVGALPVARFREVVDPVLARARAITPREQVYARMVADPVPAPAEPEPDAADAAPTPPPAPQPGEPDPDAVYRVPVGSSPVLGPSDALVTMVVFSDYQCPFCRRAEATLARLRARYGADLRVVWKHQPLPFHDHARLAAEAAAEAYAQGGNELFWRFHAALFDQSPDLARADLERSASAAGLDPVRLARALDHHTHAATIDADSQLGSAIGADGTPTFFINGVRFVGAQPEEAFARVIDDARRRAQAAIDTQGATRATVYERLTGNGATALVRLPGGSAPGRRDVDEDRVYDLRANPRAPSRGPASAPIVIEYFSDFQCPFCGRVRATLDTLQRRYAGRLRLVWRNYPLAFHDRAMEAAEAALEAHAQGGNARFWQMYDLLFDHQRELERADLERYARRIGLDMARFRRALDDHTHQAAIRADMAAADATGIAIGTPAFFINGRSLVGAVPIEQFERRIDAALAARPDRGRPARPSTRRRR